MRQQDELVEKVWSSGEQGRRDRRRGAAKPWAEHLTFWSSAQLPSNAPGKLRRDAAGLLLDTLPPVNTLTRSRRPPVNPLAPSQQATARQSSRPQLATVC